MEKQIFLIPNISCAHCVLSIKNKLSELEGINTVEGNADEKSITVAWELPATLEKIKNTLKKINYPAV
ncbi:MAG: heavy-metal-associated domain-containing protein [Proteobacteria bacterium]|nr:heavy-metal-associated domain-containing protein [Desulfobacteraceae bacterium]MBU2522244.1 heavy-metal-associated domain-containing protein [Pseudomonadota bacterium]MBU4014220.1 heavy-metal-associated domain-containing protein [Pseudomonadota bacterium]MBU4066882.1 heavy-metal-associated domain-containing protein [Pseudomonadota bacterium]MBU4099821.1 heavy-metal-associated domain-containing protein [Pseudomonadota bacterium]